MTQFLDEAIDVHGWLADCRARVEREIERHLPTGEPDQWLYRLVADYPRRSGKALRAALCLASCSAHGGAEDDALPAAAAIELVHNAFLVHDDIQDGSTWRRGGPTLHQQEGLPLAINAGDALAVLSFDVLRTNAARLGRAVSRAVVEEFTSAIWRALEGQALELGWRRDCVLDVSPQDYLELTLRKSCWYTAITPLRIGAVIGSRGRAELGPLTRFGFYLGAAFQITDDVLNLTGEEGVYGKEINGDLREGKRTLMLIHTLAVADRNDRGRVVELLRRPEVERTDDELAWLARLMECSGSIAFAKGCARGIGDAAASELAVAFADVPRPEAAAVIAGLVDYVVERTR